MKISKAQILRRVYSIPEIRFEDQRLSSYSGLVVIQELFKRLGLRSRLKGCFQHIKSGAIVGFQGCDAVITGNKILNNHADMYGGGIHLRQWSHGIIENNQMEENDSALGAGVHITYLSSPEIIGNRIAANVASALGGGGIYIYYHSHPQVERNVITGNKNLSHLNGRSFFLDIESR